MRFKHIPLVLLLTLTTPLFSGCFLFNDSPDAGQLGQVGPPQPDCLNDFPDRLNEYFNGDMQDDQAIADMWECSAKGMESFLLLTRGAEQGAYQPLEIQEFLNRYFAQNQKISSELMRQAMILKSSTLGGVPDRILRAEVTRVVEFLRLIKKHAPRIKRLMPLNGDRVERLTDQEIETSFIALRQAAEELGEFLKEGGTEYSLSSAQALLAAFEANFPAAAVPGSGLKLLREQIPLFNILKRIFIHSEGDVIRSSEWQRFLLFGARIHAVYFEFMNQDRRRGEGEWFSQEGLDRLQTIANRAVDILSDAAGFHPGGVVAPVHMRDLVRLLVQMKANRGLDSIEMTDTVSNMIGLLLSAKQMLFGGPLYEWDMGHAVLTKPFIDSMKRPAWILYNHIIKNKDLIADMPEEQFAALKADVSAAVVSTVNAFVALRNSRNNIEEQATLNRLLTELRPLFKEDDVRDLLTEGVSFLFSIKGALQGAPYDRILTTDWRPMLMRVEPLARAYLHTLRRVDTQLPENQREIRRLWPVAEAGFDALESAAAARAEGITISELYAVIDTIPRKLREEMLLDPRDLPFVRSALPELYAFKSSLFGGVQSTITAAEMASIRRVLTVGKDSLLSVLPYFPFTMDEFFTWPAAKAEEFAAVVETVGVNMADALPARGGMNYSLDRAYALIDLFKNRYPEQDWQKPREYVAVFGAAKSIIVRPPYNVMLQTDWRDTVMRSSRWAAAAVRMLHLFKNYEGLSYGRDLARISSLFYTALDLLKAATTDRGGAARDSTVILFADWDRLFDEVYALAEREQFKMPLTKPTVKSFLRPGVQRLLGGLRWDVTGRQARGLTTQAVDFVRSQIENWRQGALLLDRLYTDLTPQGTNPFKSDGFTREALITALDQAARNASTPSEDGRDVRLRTIERTKAVVQNLSPLFMGEDLPISIIYDNRREHLYSFSNMAQMNTHWILVNTFLQGYSDDLTRARNLTGVTEAELVIFASDTYELLQELKFGNPDQGPTELGAQRFFEANLFTSKGNGDAYFGEMEAVEYLAFLMSAKEMAKRAHAEILAQCPGGELDYADRETFTRECFKRYFFDKDRFHSRFTQYLPRMAYYFTTLTDAKFDKFVDDLLAASIPARQAHLPVDTSHMENAVMIPFYVESLFKRFDVNRSGVLSIEESLEAYPLVCPLILDVTNNRFKAKCTPGETGFVDAVFGYLLKYGAPPPDNADNFFDTIDQSLGFLNWTMEWRRIRRRPDALNRRFSVDRARIMSIVGALAVTTPAPAAASSTSTVATPAASSR